MKKIVIAGSNGLIGKFLVKQFEALHYEVLQISRKPEHIQWQEEEKMITALENSEALINLAGKSVDCRYNEKNKKEILDSRINTTMLLGKAVKKCKVAPKVWFNASTATIYRHETVKSNTEDNGIIGDGFSVIVAKQWEDTFFSFKQEQTRQIALRIAIVLSEQGGALPVLKKLCQIGLGGKQGNGEQYFSWIHIEDLFEIILFLINNQNINGPINCCSPNAIKNKDLMKVLRKKSSFPFGIPLPAWVLKVGAKLIHTEPELVLKSRWVYPEKLLRNNYHFKYTDINLAI